MKPMHTWFMSFVVAVGISSAGVAHAQDEVTYTPVDAPVTYSPTLMPPLTLARPVFAPVERVPVSPSLRTAGFMAIGVGGAATVGSLGVLLVQGAREMTRQHCTGGSDESFSLWPGFDHAHAPVTCTTAPGPSKDVTFAALGTMGAGIATALLGVSFVVVGGHRVERVSATVSPTGGSLRVTF